MNNPRLIHDCSHAMALHLLGVFSNLLREEEKQLAFDEVYEIAKTGIEVFVEQAEREWKRLHPLVNRN